MCKILSTLEISHYESLTEQNSLLSFQIKIFFKIIEPILSWLGFHMGCDITTVKGIENSVKNMF